MPDAWRGGVIVNTNDRHDSDNDDNDNDESPDGPDVEHPLHHLLYTALLEQSHQRRHAGNIDRDLSENEIIFKTFLSKFLKSY